MAVHLPSAFVLDCSATIAWVLEDDASQWATQLLHHMMPARVVVPSLWRTEVANALRSAIRMGRITRSKAQSGLEMIDSFDIQLAATELSHKSTSDILSFTLLHDLSAYDSGYLYLAMQFELPLATLDKNLRRAAASAKIELL